MAGKLSFSIAINLLTENFKRGTNNVKNAFNSMQAQILTFAAAMGFAGVSLSNFFSQLIQVARETSKAVTALKNVSGSTAQFASNLRFTTQLAKKYGAYVNDLTGNFAKFSVAASISGMAMEDQRKLFESLSRAAAGFGMSADESNGMFLAVTQMMGKGKIQAEELRGQLGERLPIAMQAMAKAAGTTVAGLDKIMKAGKLLSVDVLPKFADALNEMLPNINTDNIETSLNRLKNGFQEFTENTGIQGAYKSMIDGLTSFVNYAKDKISMLVTFIIALISGKLLTNVAKYIQTQNGYLNGAVRKHELAEVQKTIATDRRIKAENLLAATQRDYENIVNGQRMASDVQLEKAKSALKVAKAAENKAILAATVAAEKGAAIQSMGFWEKSGSVIVASAKNTGKALKAIWSTVGPIVLITAISAVVAKLVDTYKEAKRVKDIFSDYKTEVHSAGNSNTEVIQMQSLLRIMNDRTKYQDEINAAQNELQKMLGVENKSQGDLNRLVAERIALLKEAAKADLYARKIAETEDKINTVYGKYGGESALNKKYLKDSKEYTDAILWAGPKPQVMQDLEEIVNLKKVLADANAHLDKSVLSANKNTVPTGGEPDDKKTSLQKEEEKYAASVKELTNKLNNRAITEDDYKKQLNDLNKATYDTLSGMLTPDGAANNKTYQTVKGFSVSSEFSEEQKKYEAELMTYSNQLKNGALTEKGYQEAKLSLLESTIKAIASMDNLTEAETKYLADLLSNAQGLRSGIVDRPETKTRDKTFDYKKSEMDITSEELSIAKENLDKIKDAYNAGAKDLTDELNAALTNVTSLEDALKIAEVKKDIKDLSKELNEGLYSGVKDIASSSDRLVSAFSSLRDVFSDEDATTWERIMAVWNAMINTVDAFMSIVKTIEALTKITEKLAKAKEAEAAIDTTVTAIKVANAATEATAEVTSAGVSIVADTAASAVKKKTATENVVASTAEGVAEAGASAASLPFPWNLVAIGGAIAAAMAAFAVIPKFANGGILSGSTTGDRNIARFNGGEMFLNGRQQATLFQIANGKGIKTSSGGDSKVEFEIRYDKLVGVLKNGDQKARRGR